MSWPASSNSWRYLEGIGWGCNDVECPQVDGHEHRLLLWRRISSKWCWQRYSFKGIFPLRLISELVCRKIPLQLWDDLLVLEKKHSIAAGWEKTRKGKGRWFTSAVVRHVWRSYLQTLFALFVPCASMNYLVHYIYYLKFIKLTTSQVLGLSIEYCG